MRDPSAAAQEELVQRLFGRFEWKLKAQWQSTTKEIQGTLLEVDSVNRAQVQMLAQRQSESIEAAREAIATEFDCVAKPADYVVSQAGSGLCKQWVVEFVGNASTAARRALQVLASQRIASGTRKRVDITTPDCGI